ncbi:uncharacterized protein LOC116289386 [Actinia tenebrosa]|uniref:Uncharacterized protein LOC116289386 n=1 Tax=Actinia tenebrosa TaxID=6105 RepID=A0A6P8HAH8_ACTTE|nr:uncharacterized protein LOC116289386 [Actinia tenebrosa]
MESFHLIGLILAAFVMTLDMTSAASKRCDEGPGLAKCVTQYVSGFASPQNAKLDSLKLHCKLDRELALCTDKELATCPGKTLKALGRAVLSYIAFDRKLGACPKYGYWSLYQKLLEKNVKRTFDDDDDDDDDASPVDKNSWNYKINTLLHVSKYSRCAKRVDISCVRRYVARMRKDQNLCANIVFKHECLRVKTCEAGIITDLLNVFPEEAKKVLAVLCVKAEDSG